MLHVQSPPLTRIVTALDVVKDIRSGLRSCAVVLPVHPFPVEHAEEALGGGIVGAAADCTHATSHLMGLQEPSVFFRGKLAAAIRVENDRRSAGPLPQGHQHRLDHQLAVLTRTHRPAHDQARIQIQHDAQVQPVFGSPNVGDVGDPFGIGRRGAEVPVEMILGSVGPDPGALHPPLPPWRHALEPRSAHQARHPVAATPLAGVAQVLPDARTAHDAVLVGVQRPNPRQ